MEKLHVTEEEKQKFCLNSHTIILLKYVWLWISGHGMFGAINAK